MNYQRLAKRSSLRTCKLFLLALVSIVTVSTVKAGNPLEEIGNAVEGVRETVEGAGEAIGAGNLGNSDYQIVNTTTGKCSHVNSFPGGDVGLLDLRKKYPDPYFVVNYGNCQ